MSSNSAPYATLHDLPKFEKRTADVRAPWFKEQAAAKNVRGQVPLPYVTCNSKNAPYATFDNVPKPAERTIGAYLRSSLTCRNQPSAPASVTSQLNGQMRKLSAPYGTSNDVLLPRNQANLAKVHQAPWDRSDSCKLDHHPSQANASKVHQAPWDRNDVHHKVQPRKDAAHYTSSSAPYATESKRG